MRRQVPARRSRGRPGGGAGDEGGVFDADRAPVPAGAALADPALTSAALTGAALTGEALTGEALAGAALAGAALVAVEASGPAGCVLDMVVGSSGQSSSARPRRQYPMNAT